MRFLSSVFEVLSSYRPSLLLGVRTTLFVALTGTLFGFLIGLFVGAFRAIQVDRGTSKAVRIFKRFGDLLLGAYITLFRGTPMMVQAAFLYYAFLNVFHWNALTAAVVVISINTGAYMSEIIRAGIQAVDSGQKEAARALGMSNSAMMFHIVIPQAIRNVFPAIGNELIVNIKDSSAIMIISITELMFESKSIAGSTFRFTETYFIEAMIYLFLTSIAAFILNRLEMSFTNTKTSLPQSVSDPREFPERREAGHVRY